MYIHSFKRNSSGHIKPHHNHSRNPKKYNIAGSFHYISGVESFKIFIIRILKSDVGPLTRRKPGIESIGVSDKFSITKLTHGFFRRNNNFFAFFHIFFSFGFGNASGLMKPCRDRDAPDDLPGDIPVHNVFEPVNGDFFIMLGDIFNFTLFYFLQSFLRQGFHLNEPLAFNLWLNNGSASVASFHYMLVIIFYFFHQSFLLKFLNYERTRPFYMLSRELTRDGK